MTTFGICTDLLEPSGRGYDSDGSRFRNNKGGGKGAAGDRAMSGGQGCAGDVRQVRRGRASSAGPDRSRRPCAFRGIMQQEGACTGPETLREVRIALAIHLHQQSFLSNLFTPHVFLRAFQPNMNRNVVIFNGPNLDRPGQRKTTGPGIAGDCAAVRPLLKLGAPGGQGMKP